VANVTAAPYGPGDGVAEMLVRQITAPVRWEESIRAMLTGGAASFVEVGPGKVLSGLVRRIGKEAAVAAFCSPPELAAARASLG
jgi:[acyl-carrier-protein] S-malonyltransferase